MVLPIVSRQRVPFTLEKAALSVATVVMILRVWAMYNRSRLILYILLVSFVLEIISVIIGTAIHSVPRNLSGMYE